MSGKDEVFVIHSIIHPVFTMSSIVDCQRIIEGHSFIHIAVVNGPTKAARPSWYPTRPVETFQRAGFCLFEQVA